MTKYNVNGQEQYLIDNNLLGAKNTKQLEQLEGVAFYISEIKVEEEGFEFLFPLNINAVQTLHRKLFGEIYSFAGIIRDKGLMKQNTRFCEPFFIENQLINICSEIEAESEWKSVNHAASRLAYFKTELNMTHPFREGNGRTIRLIIRELAKKKGYDLNFELFDDHEYVEAMILSKNDTSKLEQLILTSLKAINY